MWFLKDIFTFKMCIEINEWMNELIKISRMDVDFGPLE